MLAMTERPRELLPSSGTFIKIDNGLMRIFHVLSALTLATLALSRSLQHVGKSPNALPKARRAPVPLSQSLASSNSVKHNVLKHRSIKTDEFKVDGTKIPEVDFDIGESYAGLLPISQDPNETRQLYFWYFPTQNPAGQDDITIWLNGGPGCSSLEGLLQGNGPFLWQYGTFKPVRNPYTWVNLTNMIWVEQPVGTGFSQGTPTATSETDVAEQFLGFFKNFIDTFDLQNKRIYITGESYAGYYVPYIADAMLNANDTKYYDLQGTMIYDPSLASDEIQEQIPAVPFVDYWGGLFPFNRSFSEDIHRRADSCGYTSYLNEYLTFPPKGSLPQPTQNQFSPNCDIYSDIFRAIAWINPCFDIYQVATTCPLLWDVMGFPGSFDYLPEGATIYFDRADVKAVINAPVNTTWAECTSRDVFVGGKDQSPFSSVSVLPGVIERSKRTIIAHGALDMILIANGSLLAIQNMTFNGAQGFQSPPTDDFFVPYHNELSFGTIAGAGVFGKTHTERGLTWVEVSLAGHMVPQYAPTAAYRTLEFLLGRVDSLTTTQGFTG
ncbi:MAG: hypothetical protein M1816_001753 [Peltula sp. TS41687]|nr:MAG: hypothetical protein M1816_001753 [Peltula sp. TS41687]